MPHTKRLGFETRVVVEIAANCEVSTARGDGKPVSLPQISDKEAFMTLRRTLTGLALCVMALALFMGCAESGPLPPPPMVETPPPPLYFVNISSLALREGPSTAAPQIGTLQFNDEVEILETRSGWARVGDARRDRTGWASMRYLQPVPADRPRTVPRKRPAPPPKEPVKPAEPPKAM
jgi:Bacterial SH3 domain